MIFKNKQIKNNLTAVKFIVLFLFIFSAKSSFAYTLDSCGVTLTDNSQTYYLDADLGVPGEDCITIATEGIVIDDSSIGRSIRGNIVAASSEIISPDTDGFSFTVTGSTKIRGNINANGNGVGGVGTVTFAGDSSNWGTISNANAVFYGTGTSNKGKITGDVDFSGFDSYNEGEIIGDVDFTGSGSYNSSTSIMAETAYVSSVPTLSTKKIQRFFTSTMLNGSNDYNYTDYNTFTQTIVSPDGDYYYALDNQSLTKVSVGTNQVIASFNPTNSSYSGANFILSPDGKYAYYFAPGANGTIYKIALWNMSTELYLENSGGSEGDGFDMAISSDGITLYAGHPGDGLIHKINTSTMTDLGQYAGTYGSLYSLALSPNNDFLYVFDGNSDSVHKVNTSSMLSVDVTSAIGITAPQHTQDSVVVSSDGQFLFVAITGGLKKITTADMEVVGFLSSIHNTKALSIGKSDNLYYLNDGFYLEKFDVNLNLIDNTVTNSGSEHVTISGYLQIDRPKITGNVNFSSTSYNAGDIVGSVQFSDSAYNTGEITGNVGFDDSTTNQGIVNGNADFSGSSYTGNPVGTVSGVVTFTNAVTFNVSTSWTTSLSGWVFNSTKSFDFTGVNSYNTATLNVNNVTFSGSGSYNNGTITATTVTFSGDSSYNLGTVNSYVEFAGAGSYNGGTITGNTLFSGAGSYNSGGTIAEYAVVKEVSTLSVYNVSDLTTPISTQSGISGYEAVVDQQGLYVYVSGFHFDTNEGYIKKYDVATLTEQGVYSGPADFAPRMEVSTDGTKLYATFGTSGTTYDLIKINTSDMMFGGGVVGVGTPGHKIIYSPVNDLYGNAIVYVLSGDGLLTKIDATSMSFSNNNYIAFSGSMNISSDGQNLYIYDSVNGEIYDYNALTLSFNRYAILNIPMFFSEAPSVISQDDNYLYITDLNNNIYKINISNLTVVLSGTSNSGGILKISKDGTKLFTAGGATLAENNSNTLLKNLDTQFGSSLFAFDLYGGSSEFIPTGTITGDVIFSGSTSYNAGNITGDVVFNGGLTLQNTGSITGTGIMFSDGVNSGTIETEPDLAIATGTVWMNFTGDSDWNNEDNWSAGVPVNGDNVVLNENVALPGDITNDIYLVKGNITISGSSDQITGDVYGVSGSTLGETIFSNVEVNGNITEGYRDTQITTINKSGILDLRDETITAGDNVGMDERLNLNFEGLLTNSNTYIYQARTLVVNGVDYGEWNGVFNPLTYYYNNATGDGDWNNPLNWWTSPEYTGDHPDVAPGAADTVIINGQISTGTGAAALNITFNGTSTNSIDINVINDVSFNGFSSNSGTITASTTKFYGNDTSTILGTIISNTIERIFGSNATTTRNFTTEGGTADWIIRAVTGAIVNIAGATYNLASNLFTAIQNAVFVSGNNVAGQPTPTIVSSFPTASQNVIKWKPIVDWGNADTCYFSYSGFSDSMTSVTCSNDGSDISRPTDGTNNLYLRAINVTGAGNNISEKTITFTYDDDVAMPLDSTDCSVALDEASRPYYYLTENIDCDLTFGADAEFRGDGFTNAGTISSAYDLDILNLVNTGTTTLSGGSVVSVASSTLSNITGAFLTLNVATSTVEDITGTYTSQSTITIENSTTSVITGDGYTNGSGNGGTGAIITIATSTTGAISANGGNGTGNGGNGGTITITNSYSTPALATLAASGGNSISCGSGGNAGEITINSSSYGTATLDGGTSENSGCPEDNSHTPGQTRTVTTNGSPYTPPSNNSGNDTPVQPSSNNSGSNNRFVQGQVNKVTVPVQMLKPLVFDKPLPKFGTGEGVFSFIQPIQKFLNSPMPQAFSDKLANKPGLAEYLKSIGVNTSQALVNIQNKPITLASSANDIEGIWSAYTKGLPVRNSNGEFVTISNLPISSVITGNKANILYQKIKVEPRTNFTVALASNQESAIGTFNGKEIYFTKSGNKLISNITVPRIPGVYNLTTGATPLVLSIEVEGIVPTQTVPVQQGLWGKLKSFFSW